jgi:hypothetical protein
VNTEDQLSKLHEAVQRWGTPHECWIYDGASPDDGEQRFEIRLVGVPLDLCYSTTKELIRFLLDDDATSEIEWIVFAHPSSELEAVHETCGVPDATVTPKPAFCGFARRRARRRGVRAGSRGRAGRSLVCRVRPRRGGGRVNRRDFLAVIAALPLARYVGWEQVGESVTDTYCLGDGDLYVSDVDLDLDLPVHWAYVGRYEDFRLDVEVDSWPEAGWEVKRVRYDVSMRDVRPERLRAGPVAVLLRPSPVWFVTESFFPDVIHCESGGDVVVEEFTGYLTPSREGDWVRT